MKKIVIILAALLVALGVSIASFLIFLRASVPEDKPAEMSHGEIDQLGEDLDNMLNQPTPVTTTPPAQEKPSTDAVPAPEGTPSAGAAPQAEPPSPTPATP